LQKQSSSHTLSQRAYPPQNLLLGSEYQWYVRRISYIISEGMCWLAWMCPCVTFGIGGPASPRRPHSCPKSAVSKLLCIVVVFDPSCGHASTFHHPLQVAPTNHAASGSGRAASGSHDGCSIPDGSLNKGFAVFLSAPHQPHPRHGELYSHSTHVHVTAHSASKSQCSNSVRACRRSKQLLLWLPAEHEEQPAGGRRHPGRTCRRAQ
jgi:hypothetical protein